MSDTSPYKLFGVPVYAVDGVSESCWLVVASHNNGGRLDVVRNGRLYRFYRDPSGTLVPLPGNPEPAREPSENRTPQASEKGKDDGVGS